jgi:hypothetical protein
MLGSDQPSSWVKATNFGCRHFIGVYSRLRSVGCGVHLSYHGWLRKNVFKAPSLSVISSPALHAVKRKHLYWYGVGSINRWSCFVPEQLYIKRRIPDLLLSARNEGFSLEISTLILQLIDRGTTIGQVLRRAFGQASHLYR